MKCRTRLQMLQDYLDGTADAQTAARIKAELQNPENEFARALKGLREHGPKDPCAVDFSDFFTPEEQADFPPAPGVAK